MPRANRHFIPGHVWHITHRCHKKEFLLKFSRDRSRWVSWLYEARKRYGLSVLNFIVTSNHIHLMVRDTGNYTIPRSMQLIAGRTAQEFNLRKNRKGAFWEDRYHATAIDTESHFFHCMVYIDLNMVRAGVANHPQEWKHSGYYAIQNPPKRYRLIDEQALCELTGVQDFSTFQQAHHTWVENSLQQNQQLIRNPDLTESIAVGSTMFVEKMKNELGISHQSKSLMETTDGYCIKETPAAYKPHFNANNGVLRPENTVFLNEYL